MDIEKYDIPKFMKDQYEKEERQVKEERESDFPLYPTLGEQAEREAVELIERFKENLKKAADDVLSDMYCDIAVHIETDSWENFRGQIVDGLRHYPNKKVQAAYDFKAIRQAIFKEHREEILKDIAGDIDEGKDREIARLKEDIAFLKRALNGY